MTSTASPVIDDGILVFLASSSKIKRDALERALDRLGISDVAIVCVPGIESGVPEQPIGWHQTHEGASNRLAAMLKNPQVVERLAVDDQTFIAISIESGLVQAPDPPITCPFSYGYIAGNPTPGSWGDVAAIHLHTRFRTTIPECLLETTEGEQESAFVAVPIEHLPLMDTVLQNQGKTTLGELLYQTGATTNPKAWFDRETQLADAIFNAISERINRSITVS